MKSIYQIKFAILVFFLSGFFSCADWEQTINLPNNNPTTSKRVVVIEEFTGASCVNCPPGIIQSKLIQDLYPSNVIVIAVHSKFLAQPATKGQVDLRTPDAQLIEDFLGSWFAKPEAAFNRFYDVSGQTYRFGTPDTWRTFVETELKKDPQVELKIASEFNDATRELKVKLSVKGLLAISKSIHLHCGITESEIIADQLDNSGKLVDFEHNHALRKMITSIAGDKIASSISVGELFEKEYSFVLPQDSILWNPIHCDVFAYVSLDENEKYILQAAETKVK
ncbi:MAG: Omp28-related outer membrane protein [Saprospiraceae bacterium]|nr:Omp28-related outer membrane protein [Saprospiraceae bacterium]